MKNNDERTKHVNPGSTSSSEANQRSVGSALERELGNKQVGFVSRHITKIFIAAIVLVALAIFVSGIGLMFFSDYMVFELDYNDSQREVANSTSKALSLLGFVLLILSTGLLLLSSRVAHLIAGFVRRHGQMRR